MSVYHVYTKTAHIPTYLVYNCQKCNVPVAVLGYYDVSGSYSDRGTWTRKGVAKREAQMNEKLEDEKNQQTANLRRVVTPIHSDYNHIKCQCPRCGHPSLGKIGDKSKLSNMIMKIVLGVIGASILIGAIIQKEFSMSVILGGIIFTLIGAGLVTIVAEAVIDLIEKIQMKKICSQAAPLMCSNREMLMQEAKKRPAFKDTDFSTIMRTPNVV